MRKFEITYKNTISQKIDKRFRNDERFHSRCYSEQKAIHDHCQDSLDFWYVIHWRIQNPVKYLWWSVDSKQLTIFAKRSIVDV